MSLQQRCLVGTCLVILQSGCATTHRRDALQATEPGEKSAAEAPRIKQQRKASPSQKTISANYHPPAISSACPRKDMSCYPGCATVNDLLVCGQQLMVAAGSLAAAIVLVAKEEGLTPADLCMRYETLCASRVDPDAGKARAAPKPLALRRNTPCKLVRREKDVGTPPAVFLCVYQCEGAAEEIVVELDPGIERCPGAEKGDATWEKIGGLRRRSP
ncbi:MAG TPA: hypothetical protein VK447_12115 [Myxococcaceae bacterium]|nr:hypothetical protein [Myxococcaceae bacterium]